MRQISSLSPSTGRWRKRSLVLVGPLIGLGVQGVELLVGGRVEHAVVDGCFERGDVGGDGEESQDADALAGGVAVPSGSCQRWWFVCLLGNKVRGREENDLLAVLHNVVFAFVADDDQVACPHCRLFAAGELKSCNGFGLEVRFDCKSLHMWERVPRSRVIM